MSVYRIGSKGVEVRQIQQRLQRLGIYRGPLDRIFGGGTEAAVRLFQGREGLESDGVVGPLTWRALFREELLPAAITYRPLDDIRMSTDGVAFDDARRRREKKGDWANLWAMW